MSPVWDHRSQLPYSVCVTVSAVTSPRQVAKSININEENNKEGGRIVWADILREDDVLKLCELSSQSFVHVTLLLRAVTASWMCQVLCVLINVKQHCCVTMLNQTCLLHLWSGCWSPWTRGETLSARLILWPDGSPPAWWRADLSIYPGAGARFGTTKVPVNGYLAEVQGRLESTAS